MLEEKAKKIAAQAHQGQYRKDGITPYITHPEAVVGLLKKIGINDEDVLCAAWLHDTIEDCSLTREDIEREFNTNIAKIVNVLTRNIDREEYKKRMANSGYAVQIIKLADTVHNCSELNTSLPEKTIKTKVDDCKSFYFSLAEKVCPEFHKLLLEYLRDFL